MKDLQEEVLVQIYAEPFSSDPIEYDFFIHHAIFRSVFAGLISNYGKTGFQGIIAKSWSSSSDFKTWKFVIREGLFFEDHSEINPQTVVQSFFRIAKLQCRKGSISGFFEQLEEFTNLANEVNEIDGLTFTETEVILRFVKPQPKALENLSFGIYSIVHPSQYDLKTLAWKNKKLVISSYGYRLEIWDSNQIVLQKRDDFFIPGVNDFSPQTLRFKTNFNKPDIILGADSLCLKNDFQFYGPVPSGIIYLQIQSWANPSGPFYSKERRIAFRDSIYRAFFQKGDNPSYTFFPLILKNVQKMELPFLIDCKLNNFRIINAYVSNRFDQYIEHAKIAAESMSAEFIKKKFSSEELMTTVSDYKTSTYDLIFSNTSLNVDDPDDDIRFMFQSKEGIQIPDLDGSIEPLLLSECLDFQKINEKIWDQVLIIPISHYSNGFWANNRINVQKLNLNLVPFDFNYFQLN
ncbi:MAG: ABC transporter substrate-binding protein [Bacteriovoracaceae bacterium]